MTAPFTLPDLAAMDDQAFLKVMQQSPKPWMWRDNSAAYRYSLLRKANIDAYRPVLPERLKTVEELVAGWNV